MKQLTILTKQSDQHVIDTLKTHILQHETALLTRLQGQANKLITSKEAKDSAICACFQADPERARLHKILFDFTLSAVPEQLIMTDRIMQ